MDKMKGYVEAIKENRAYDYILNYGHSMSKDELIRIIAEFDYAIHSTSMLMQTEKDIIRQDVAENLKEHYELPDIYFEEGELEVENNMVKIPAYLFNNFKENCILVVGLVHTDEKSTVVMRYKDTDYIYCDIID